MDMMEILQVAGIIGLLVFSCMRVWASNTAHFWGYNLVYAAAIFGICWAFFEAPPDEALIAALIATTVAHLLSALVTRRRSARDNTTARFTRTTPTPTPTPSFTRTTTPTQPETSTTKAAPTKPATPKPAAPAPKPTTPAAKPASAEKSKTQQPKAATATEQKPKTTTQKPTTSTQQPKAEKKEVKQTLTCCLKCGKTIASSTCGYCRYNNTTGSVRLLCRIDPRKLQINKPTSNR